MPKKHPYKGWTKDELFFHLKRQAEAYDSLTPELNNLIYDAIFDDRWNPILDFNGCNLVQDDLHPFLPCFIHDWRWITNQDIELSNIEFKNLLIAYGYPKWKAELYFIGVTIGWHCYFRWV